MLRFKRTISFLLLAFLFLGPNLVLADKIGNLEINYNQAAFTSSVVLRAETSDQADNFPWEWAAITPIFSYSLDSRGIYDPSRPLSIKVNYQAINNNFKQVFIYDELSRNWQPVLTHDFPREKYVTAETTSLSGRLVVLSNPDILVRGTASWYKFKNGLFAASPDFAKGTTLRVHNLDNGKFVDVTINDWGPERGKHPDRVVDLDKVAFAKIADTGAGLVNVKIEPLKIIVPEIKKNTPQSGSQPNITASSAIIMLESTAKIIWSKNAKESAPLASLTKLVAARVFLDTKPDLKKIVAYKTQDEKYNYEYCKPWESARLKVKDGEKMTIENLLYSALVGSANNAVESLVRVSGLSREKFIARMNETVKNWGATSTHFIEPTGLSPLNVSSPYDYAIITKEVFAQPLIQKISTTKSYSFKTTDTKKAHTLTNTNQLLRSSAYQITGSKTGYLEEAGHCLMTRVKSGQDNLIVVNFGSTGKAENFSDNEQLLRYGQRYLNVAK